MLLAIFLYETIGIGLKSDTTSPFFEFVSSIFLELSVLLGVISNIPVPGLFKTLQKKVTLR